MDAADGAVPGVVDARFPERAARPRRAIEQVFRTTKRKGFDIEARRIGDARRATGWSWRRKRRARLAQQQDVWIRYLRGQVGRDPVLEHRMRDRL